MTPLNKLNLHFAFHLYAFAIAETFGAIYFYKLGIPIPTIFFYWSIFFSGRLFFRPFIFQLCAHISPRTLYLIGTLFYALRYPLYALLTGLNSLLLTLLCVEIIASTIYWTIYHAYYAHLGSIKKRGAEVALRESIAHIVNFIAPISSGFIIQYYGFDSAFYLAAASTCIGMLPILRLPHLPQTESISIQDVFKRTDYTGFWYYFACAVHVVSHLFTWKLVVYIAMGDYAVFGSLMSIAVLFQIIGTFLVGHTFDKGKADQLLTLAVILLMITIVIRVSMTLTIPIIISSEIIYMIGVIILNSIINATVYNASKRSSRTIEFQFMTESGWDLGAIFSTALAGLLTSYQIPLTSMMAIGLVGVFLFWIIGRHVQTPHLDSEDGSH